MSPQELPSIWSLIMARKKVAWTVFGACVAAGVGYTLFAPSIWEAKATLLFPVRTPSLLGAGSFEQTSLAVSLAGGPTPLKVYGGMLESERALNYVSRAAGLTRREVKAMRSLQDQAMESSLTISARNSDPALAKKVVALHLEALEDINEKVSRPMAAGDANVLRARLEEQKKKVAEAEVRLLAFQNKAVSAPSLAGAGKEGAFFANGSKWSQVLKELELDHNRVDRNIREVQSRTQSVAKQGGGLPSALPPVQKWRERLTGMQYDLKIQELTLAPEAPELVKLRKTIAITEAEMRSELKKFAQATSQGSVDIGASDGDRLSGLIVHRTVLESQIHAVKKIAAVAPAEAIELSRLSREVATQSGILQELESQVELAEIQAVRDPNRWQILDEPQVDEKPVNKSFAKNGVLSVIAGLALGAFAALAWPKRKAPEAAQIQEIKRAA